MPAGPEARTQEGSRREDEVRYHLLRPGEIVRRRKACPVAYVPIKTIEWHGVHNPVGADTLQAEELAIRCARLGGGLAFPPLYYGEPRLTSLMEANSPDAPKIAAAMELPTDGFTDPERWPVSPVDEAMHYQTLLLRVLAEVKSLGFAVGVLVAGHYPLIDHARSAVLQFNHLRDNRRGGMLAWAFVDYLLVADEYDCAGDHAGGWETSHVLATCPEAVDLSLLPPKGETLLGAGGRLAPQDATAAFGEETLQRAAEVAVREVAHRVAHPQRYRAHGCSLLEGLWKDPDAGDGQPPLRR